MKSFEQIDLLFPYFVFAYGATITFVLHLEPLVRLAEQKLPRQMLTQIQMHRHLAFICLVVGSLWSLQNIILR